MRYIFAYFTDYKPLKLMKKVLFVLCLGLSVAAHAQQAQNIIIVTTDGFRWQDLFKGMDDTIAQQKRFNEGDSL